MKNPGEPLIFILDQSATYRRIIEACMSALNFRNVVSFGNIQDCISAGEKPDIFILDDTQGKDHLSGIDFLRIYKTRYPASKFIFLSSNTNLNDAVTAIKFGASDYIVKSKSGLDRLVKLVDKLVKYQIREHKYKLAYKAAVVSLGMFSLLFALAIYFYNTLSF